MSELHGALSTAINMLRRDGVPARDEIADDLAALLGQLRTQQGDAVGEIESDQLANNVHDPSFSARLYDGYSQQFHTGQKLYTEAPPAKVPEGYVLVPVNATLGMVEAGRLGDPLGCDVDDEDMELVYSKIWAAMLYAAKAAQGE